MSTTEDAWEIYEIAHGTINNPSVVRVDPKPRSAVLRPPTLDDYKLAVEDFFHVLEQIESLAFALANKLEGKVPGP